MKEIETVAVPHTVQLVRGEGAGKRRCPSSNNAASTTLMSPKVPTALEGQPPPTAYKTSSPSSVLSLVHSPSRKKHQRIKRTQLRRAATTTVVMEDHAGAEFELVAEFHSLSMNTTAQPSLLRTPRKAVKSLLDDESTCQTPTPTPSKKLGSRTPSSVSTAEVSLCCPNFYAIENCMTKYDNGIVEVMNLQKKIHALLGDPNLMEVCERDWQMWSILGTTSMPTNNSVSEEEVKNALRNSIALGLERQKRMDSVRRDLNPFTLTPSRKKPSSVRLKTVYSFDPSRFSPMKRGAAPPRDKNASTKNNLTNLVAMLEEGCLCNPNANTVTQADSPALVRKGMLNDVHGETCYDSDPEDFTRRRSRKLYAGSPGSPSNKENRHQFVPRTPRSRASADDDYVIGQMVQEFMNETFTLILHFKDNTSKSTAPSTIKAWFERGQYLGSGGIIQPRFTWHVVQKNSSKSKRKAALPATQSLSFDIIDIARVLAVDNVDRKQFPFARPSSCFLVKTLDRSYLFEAESGPERERLCRLLKLLVARLGSKLIVGDETFFEEFFIANMPADGPGEAPEFF